MSVESPFASVPGATASNPGDALACSRCDGPVNPDDLVEGLAVRIDGLTVCALCIETLSPALRIQINRVRALKGLAVVTYRVVRRAHPTHQFYSFTNAGMLLLHRRALVHGTEFNTPDLPASIPSAAPSGPATVALHSPPPRSKQPLYLGLGAAGIVAIAGILAVVLSSHTPRKTAPRPVETSAPNMVTPAMAEPPAAAVPLVPVVDSVSKKRELKDYRNEFAEDEKAALEAGLSNHVSPELISQLEGDVLSRGHANLERLSSRLLKTSLDPHELDDIGAALAKAQPPVRPAFAELQQDIDGLVEMVANKRRLLTAAKETAALAAQPAPVSRPAGAVASLPPAGAPVPASGEVAKVELPVVTEPAPVASKSLQNVRSSVSLWSGDIGPKPALFADPAEQSQIARIPSPWPFFISPSPPRFAAAVKVRGPERKDVFTLQLTFTAAQVRNGGVYLTLYPKRKELLLTRLDAANAPAQVLSFTDREHWQGFSYRVENVGDEMVTLQIREGGETSSDPFWLGATAAISNGDPAGLADEISPSPVLTANPLIEWSQLVASLKVAARGRRQEQRWYDQKVLPCSAIKIFGPTNISAEKLNAALRLRRPAMSDVVNQIEVANVRDPAEFRKLFAPKANPGLLNQRTIPTTVFLIPNGSEATVTPAEWAKHVRQMNDLLRDGDGKIQTTGYVPVWVIGSLTGAVFPTTAWSKLRTDNTVLLLDLTNASLDGTESAKKVQSDTYQYFAEGIHTLLYQLRLVQATQASR